MSITMRERTQAEIDALPKDVFAGPGDSYPIETVADLENAIQAFGRSSDPAVTKRGIIRRARALGKLSLLPEDWNVPDGDNDADDRKQATEPQEFAGARHNKVDMAKIQQSHDHMVSLGANCFPPSQDQINNMTNRDMSEEHAQFIQMAEAPEDPDHRALIFDLPQWFNAADAPPEWVPYLPKPTTFKHPRYGDVAFTPERNAGFVAKFNSGVYQIPVPLDGEHLTKQSGAMAWVYALRQNDDHSVDAQVKWTPRGEKMYREGSFKYVSPEFNERWQDPATGEWHKDVPIGGALTTRPFFKASHLRPLAASEDHTHAPDEGEGGSGMTATMERETEVKVKDFSELEQRFTEMERQYSEVVSERDALKETVEKQGESIAALQAEARTKRFTEEVKGWVGDPKSNIANLEHVAELYGEDSAQFKEEVRRNKAFAEQVALAEKAGGSIFREFGSSQSTDTDSKTGRLMAMAEERAAASNGAKTYQQAYAEVLEQHPELYEG